jgi:hypothetical protein
MELSDGRPTWYFAASGTKLGDLYNILHVPYTAMVLAFVIIGAAASPMIHFDRLGATLLAYFLGLGIGAHSLDQLEPQGSHYVKKLSRRELASIAILSLGTAAALGLYYVLTIGVLLIPFIAAGVFFAVAYPLPSRTFGAVFHNHPTFALSWGFLPAVTSYFVNAVALTPAALVVGVATASAAWIEIRLSRSARSARRQGLPAVAYRGQENGLRLLVGLTCSFAVLSLAWRLA